MRCWCLNTVCGSLLIKIWFFKKGVNMRLSEVALLVSLSISQWTARRLSPKATAEIGIAHNTGREWARGQINLIAEREIKTISAIGNEIRALHKANTLKWADGVDLLSSSNYMDYCEKIRSASGRFDGAVTRLIRVYPALVQEAKDHLNGLFDPSDYPAVEQLQGLYGVHTEFFPVPEGGDIRVKIGDAERAAIAASIEERVKGQLDGAISDVWGRLRDVVAHVADTCKVPDKIFRDSLILNLRAVCESIPKLNIMNDAKLDQFAADAAARLGKLEADWIRDQPTTRAAAAADASAILSAMSAYTGAAGVVL
jgi:hypothetical protein